MTNFTFRTIKVALVKKKAHKVHNRVWGHKFKNTLSGGQFHFYFDPLDHVAKMSAYITYLLS